ncbi:C6 zinc finger domain-containing protein [Colletotrichum kahawae]|uniref:C6 zinc finger domain-containing protein n=1 Tax=Colletotrichum kahawae TaxID=34407 RepID=A0AAD9Y1P2_COLKA|nr:C6 zinc finger domain-containing protein [Colletotrichum kahawae]
MTIARHPNQKRSACERCRRQKLRCSRQDTGGEARCSRCARLGFPCVAGQQRRIGRPSRAKNQGNNVSNDRDRACDLEAAGEDEGDGEGCEIAVLRGDELLSAGNTPAETTPTEAARSGEEVAEVGVDVQIDPLHCDFEWDETDFAVDVGDHFTDSLETAARPLSQLDAAIQHEAIVRLSKINVDLHLHLSKVDKHRQHMDLCSFIYPDSVLSVDSVTLAELALVMFQDLVTVLSTLAESMKQAAVDLTILPSQDAVPSLPWDNSCGLPNALGWIIPSESYSSPDITSPSTVTSAPEAVGPPLALIITSCLVQIITLFESITLHIHQRLESLAVDPLTPIEGLKFGAFSIGDGHLQGIIFAQIITSLLERADRLLGLRDSDTSRWSTSPHQAILSNEQRGILRGQLKEAGGGSLLRTEKLRDSLEIMRRRLTEASALSS